MKKLRFPNPFGFKLPEKSKIITAQNEFKFSDQYAQFLEIQNGLDSEQFEDSTSKNIFLIDTPEIEANQDFTVLYGIDADRHSEYYNLIENQKYNIFKDFFFIIGRDPGGNEFVEVLTGTYKGWIGSIDHDLYITRESIDEYFDFMEIGNYSEMNNNERYTQIMSSDNGLIWLHAKSMDDFTDSCFILIENSLSIADCLV